MYKIVFVDDREDQFIILNQVKREAKDTLDFFECIPEASIIDTQKVISENAPDLLLLDYRLDEKPVRDDKIAEYKACLLYTSPSPRDRTRSRMPSSA